MKCNHLVGMILFTCCLLTISFTSNAQLSFCKSVDKDGKAVNAAREFALSKEGSKIIFVLQLAPSAHPAEVSYDLYKTDKGKEVFNNTMKQQVGADKRWLSKEVTIYDAGQYVVYVYDEKDNLISKGSFSVKQSGE